MWDVMNKINKTKLIDADNILTVARWEGLITMNGY